jgi:hypothetical protein
MKNIIFKTCSFISTTLFIVSLGLYIYAVLGNPNPNVSKTHIDLRLFNVYASVLNSDGGNLIVCNRSEPFVSGTVHFVGDKSITPEGWHSCGIYFLSIRYADGREAWWTFMTNLWYPIVVFAILPAVCLVQKLHGNGHRPVTYSEATKA